MGKRDEALAIAAELIEHANERHLAPLSIARVYAGLSETERVFEWLDKAVADRSTRLAELRFDPMFAEYRGDPRFDVLLQTICLVA